MGGGGVGVGDCSGTIAEDAECLLSGFRLKIAQSHGKTDRKLTSLGIRGMWDDISWLPVSSQSDISFVSPSICQPTFMG